MAVRRARAWPLALLLGACAEPVDPAASSDADSFNVSILGQFRSYDARVLDLDPDDPHFGALFLSNLVYVDTMITAAAYDLVIYTPAIPAALETYTDLVAGVIVDPEAREWTVEYQDGVLADPGARVVSVPVYEASHAVSLDAPAQLRDDVALWLGQ